MAWKTPFISGKDSLNNEFTWFDAKGEKQSIAIPCSLLISAMGQIDDASKAITMDFKHRGNGIYLIGATREELGGSHASLVLKKSGGHVPKVDAALAMESYRKLHSAMDRGLVVSCHDLSEGGLAVAVSEMAFAGELGAELDLTQMRNSSFVDASDALFSESNSRLLVEVSPENAKDFENAMAGVTLYPIGRVTGGDHLTIHCDGTELVNVAWRDLRDAWRSPLDFE
ncbi:MAG: AIR synthase-related protein [Pirellula sp.]